ncbi:hypothetical protein BC938DRAFT_481612 [Jimgerdemannia flammicorona]|uniref:Uncharacterized protein n=1 Tax=Jimgerdemannia flammicorona TaxID=994334 RepID=A0A433QFT4_9FUNG|nr:hypothetical protein BC938DRAFT_481612 [Jimgerdemannia flammicorona]
MNVGASGLGPAAGAADGVAAGEAAPAPSEKARERRDSLNSDSDSDDAMVFEKRARHPMAWTLHIYIPTTWRSYKTGGSAQGRAERWRRY